MNNRHLLLQHNQLLLLEREDYQDKGNCDDVDDDDGDGDDDDDGDLNSNYQGRDAQAHACGVATTHCQGLASSHSY